MNWKETDTVGQSAVTERIREKSKTTTIDFEIERRIDDGEKDSCRGKDI